MIKKKRTPSLLLTLGAAVLLIGGGGAAYWILTQRGVVPGELPVGAEVVPQDALMAISVSTDPGQWEHLREFGTPQSQAAFDKNLAQLRDRLLTANGYDYAKDVQPWIGKEVTVAFLPPSPASTPTAPNAPTAQQQATVMVLPIQNQLQAKQLLEKPKQPTTGKLVDRTYKGFQIRESQGAATQNYSATVLDGKFLVVTTDPKATDRAIDTYKKEGAALSATPGYSQAIGKIQSAQSFGKLYVNLPAAAAITSANAGRSASPQSLAQVQQIQGLAATATLQPEGIQFKSISWLKPDSQRKYEVQNTAKIMPSRLPAETLIMASGGNLKRFWQDYNQGAATNPLSPLKPEDLRNGLKSTVGLDLDQDLLAWMDGEFSLSLVAAPEGSPPSLPFSFVFMVQSNDRRAAEKTLKQLDEAMASKYRFKVEESKIGDQSVVNWSLPAGGPAITHGWLDDNVAFLTLGAPIANTILPKPAAPLADSEAFKASVPSELNPNNGHFFANITLASAKNFPLLQLPPGNRELVAAVRSIGVTAAINDERSTRYNVLVLLQKAGKPTPLPSPTVPSATIAPGQGNPTLTIPSTPTPLPSP